MLNSEFHYYDFPPRLFGINVFYNEPLSLNDFIRVGYFLREKVTFSVVLSNLIYSVCELPIRYDQIYYLLQEAV